MSKLSYAGSSKDDLKLNCPPQGYPWPLNCEIQGHISVLILFDFAVVFDPVHHSLLLDTLSTLGF